MLVSAEALGTSRKAKNNIAKSRKSRFIVNVSIESFIN